jgi:hypothetical protein
MKESGETPDGVFRGDVTPPATTFEELAWCSDAYAGFSNRRTYSVADTGTENVRPFGSFHTVHSCTHGNRFDAA